MRTSTTMTLAEAVQDALDGRESRILCPAHADKTPSLAVKPGKTQPVIMRCHADCEQEAIIEAGGVNWSEVCVPQDSMTFTSAEQSEWTPAGPASAVYDYTDGEGTLLYQVCRVDKPTKGEGKRFLQRRPDETAAHKHRWNLDGVTRVLYRLPQVLEAVAAGQTIHIGEGEKVVEKLMTVVPEGEQATCNSGGAGKWDESFSEALAGATVVIYADADDPGRKHAREVRESLMTHGCTVSVMEAPPGILASGKAITDVADHIEAGRGLESLLETTPEQAERKARTGVDILDLVQRPRGTVEFVLDGTLAKGERVIVTGHEGKGKSELMRQIAVMVAAGLHPFTGVPMQEPRKVLFVDPENHPDQVQDRWSHMVGLCARLGHPIESGMLHVMEEWESEINLDRPEGEAWLMERVHAYKPDLVIMGPLTNLASRDLKDDEPVRKLRNAVNRARTICNSAWIMEHHAPLKSGQDKERPVRPYGSSLFLRWPDYGYGMKQTTDPKVFEWSANRGARVRSRQWPEAIGHGSGPLEPPWVQTLLPEDMMR